ncbi:MAG: glycoside hydrolase family 2 TIM barrel-domain containing protein [Pseudomonadota bacterium]
MPIRLSCAGLASVALLAAFAGNVQAGQDDPPGSVVKVVQQSDGSFTLLRNGEPYQVKGAGLGTGDLALLKASGGNSVRTWGITELEQVIDGKPLLDRAHELGITVTVGLWVQHVRHGFDYGDAAFIERQRKRVREAVLKYKDHPAVLTWGLGNEMEAFMEEGTDVRIWKELNHLAGMIKELDPHHPVMTVLASATESNIDAIHEYYPNIDIVGVNAYGAAAGVGKSLLESGWQGPYMLTEFGVLGTWEVRQTSWGAPIEPDPSTKAGETYTAYTLDRDNNSGRSLGSHVFFWGQKQETTSTWFGMFLPSGEKLPRVDAMAYAWTGEWPENRAPKLQSLETPVALGEVAPGSRSWAEADIIDREGDELSYTWEILAESNDRRIGGDAEAVPPSFPDAIRKGQGTPRIEFRAPKTPGAYRLFVSAYDGEGGAVVHNLPFIVK